MSLKKRMFRANMTILFAALFSLMVIILAVLALFEDSLETQLYSISGTQIEEHAQEAAQIVERLAEDNKNRSAESLVEEIQPEVLRWDYRTAVISGGKTAAGDSGEPMHDIAEFFGEIADKSGQTGIYSFGKATVIGKYLAEEDAYLVAVHFPEEHWIASSLNRSFYVFLLTAFLAGIGAIIILMFLASFVTRRMNRIVMEPVELLVAGAERIKNRNLNEKIIYHGETEFEHVCETFNDMQQTILDDQEQRAKTERARTDMVTGTGWQIRMRKSGCI